MLLIVPEGLLLKMLLHNEGDKGGFDSSSLCEELGDLNIGLDSFQSSSLDGQALAPLSTTRSENSAAALGSHTSTEAVALGALAFVRLIGAFHCFFPFHGSKSSFQIIYHKEPLSTGLHGENARLRGGERREYKSEFR